MKALIHTGRTGIALRGYGTGVVCWPHANALKGNDGVVLFQIRPNTARPCIVCTQITKETA